MKNPHPQKSQPKATSDLQPDQNIRILIFSLKLEKEESKNYTNFLKCSNHE